MMNRGTISYDLALMWMTRPTYGIAFIGYQHPDTPGYALMSSPKNEPFDLAGRRARRTCEIERFRFTSHASRDGIVALVEDTTPSTVVIVHGEPDACDGLALAIRDRRPGTRIIIPRKGTAYDLQRPPHAVSDE
jgi:Cft2 family RNA processing exonuclease